jgi:hypothetical protein
MLFITSSISLIWLVLNQVLIIKKLLYAPVFTSKQALSLKMNIGTCNNFLTMTCRWLESSRSNEIDEVINNLHYSNILHVCIGFKKIECM